MGFVSSVYNVEQKSAFYNKLVPFSENATLACCQVKLEFKGRLWICSQFPVWVLFNRGEMNSTGDNNLCRNYLLWTCVYFTGSWRKSKTQEFWLSSLREKKKKKKNEAPVEIIEAEPFLMLLRRAAESKLYEKNKGGNVMCQPSPFSCWLHAQSLNSY